MQHLISTIYFYHLMFRYETNYKNIDNFHLHVAIVVSVYNVHYLFTVYFK